MQAGTCLLLHVNYDAVWCGIFLRPTGTRLSKCPPYFLSVKLVTKKM